ncbi:MAG: hypothetical protein OES13_08245 [Acidimicrobiia bacterium]|nr:hypothetical protein [Acidimicrobiia bacterium]
MASASFSHSAPVNASRDDVWERLQEAEAWAAIGPIDKVWDATHDGAGLLESFQWSAHAAGRNFNGSAQTSAAIPAERMVIDIKTSEVAGAIEVTLSDGAIEATMSLHPVGFLASLFFGAVASTVGEGLPGHVDEFAAQFG